MTRYIIMRKAIPSIGETEDVVISNKFTEKLAQDWIDTQQNQTFKPSMYYIKRIEIS